MAYEYSEVLGVSGNVGTLPFGGVPSLFQVLGVLPQLYLGCHFVVEERIVLQLDITEPKYIDTDFRYVYPRYRLGNYQLVDADLNYTNEEWRRGEISWVVQNITRRRGFTVGARSDANVVDYGGLVLNTCNALLAPGSALFPGDTIPTTGLVFDQERPLFNGFGLAQRTGVKDDVYDQDVGGIGIYLNPGVVLEALNYSARLVSLVENDRPESIPQVCQFSSPDCDGQFAGFLAGDPCRFEVLIDCEDSIANGTCLGGFCELLNWVCPTDSSVVRQYYFPVAV